MAFVSPSSSIRAFKHFQTPLTAPRRVNGTKWCTQADSQASNLPDQPSLDPPSSLTPASTPSIPPSLAAACALALHFASAALLSTNRIFVEIDTASGDETYTMLKTSVPVAFSGLPIAQVLLPDAGAAAYARKDWPDITVLGMGEAEAGASLIVTPRAREVSALLRLAETPETLVLLNPDLVDMGVTGLSLDARRLREDLIGNFTMAYYPKVFPWGVTQGAWPGKWGVWVDVPRSEVAFRLFAKCDDRILHVLDSRKCVTREIAKSARSCRRSLSVHKHSE